MAWMWNIMVFLLGALVFAASGQAAQVRMAFGEKISPFCFPETDTGIEIEIIREALAFRGHTLKPVYYPFARVPVAFRAGQVDAAMSDLGQDVGAPAYYGDPAVFYDNVFITLKERGLSIKRPEDLRGLRVIAFPGALKRYPAWLSEVQKDNRYYEQSNQSLQVLTLAAGHYDVVLSDRNIFRYFTLQLQKEQKFQPKPVQLHSFVTLNPADYRPVFKDGAIRDDFNAGLKHLKSIGRVDAIYKKYLGNLNEPN